jgi:hypothetical protein
MYSVRKQRPIDNNTAQKAPVYYIFRSAASLCYDLTDKIWNSQSENYTVSWSGCLHLLSCVVLTVLEM